ncbi:hypothetical protein FKR81_01310 [Lentzea tibetensis]|uniref:Rieske domain-containing protein n=1 Tax=Lentzea tibetensis TaxID=2591470 RepID=A0A563F2N8_9PSEU|nr:NifU family protein [Lentzea tibetensis]TWP54225.1 hypothetical protein FKR81_01310 [Lentzea tibetensis]
MTDAREVGARIEELVASLPPRAEELVRLLVGLYGDCLERIAEVVDVRTLTADPLVESLLLVHGLHPDDVDTRVQRALDKVRPYLGSHAGGVEYLGVTDDGVAHLRLEGSCSGCPSSTETVRMAIEGAIEVAAPELSGIDVEGVVRETVLQIGMGPPPGWTALPAPGPPTGKPEVVSVNGVAVLTCAVRGTLYAYRDTCPVCAGSLGTGTLAGERLTCPGCGSAFDVRLHGAGLDGLEQHLDPVPLLSDGQGLRVAVAS